MRNRVREHLIFFVTILLPIVLCAQSGERLFCAVCGKQAELKALFCYECGAKLDKSALLSRLKDRLAKADSLKQEILVSSDEISLLVNDAAETKARALIRSGGHLRSRTKTKLEKTLDVVVPIVAGSAAAYFMGQMFYRIR